MALLSPGIEIKEIDASTIVPTMSNSIGVFCGNFHKGPINQRVFITEPDDLKKVFGLPTDDNYNEYFQAWNFLQYQNSLYVVRQEGEDVLTQNVKQDGTGTGTSYNDRLIPNWDYFENNQSFLRGSQDITFYQSTPGKWGNEIQVCIQKPEDFEDASALAFEDVLLSSLFEYYPEEGTEEIQVQVKNGNSLESFLVSLDKVAKDSNGKNIFIENVINNQSEFIYVTVKNGLQASEVNSKLFIKAGDGYEDLVITQTLDGVDSQNNPIPKNSYIGSIESDVGGKTETNGTLEVTQDDVVNGRLQITVGLEQDAQHGDILIVNEVRHKLTLQNISDAEVTLLLLQPKSIDVLPLVLAEGSDGEEQTKGDLAKAYNLFDNKEEIDVDIVIGNEIDDGISQINLANYRKDCIQFYGSPEEPVGKTVIGSSQTNTVENILEWRKREFNHNTMFACIQGNYKYQYDSYNDKNRWVNLQGDIQGLRAQTNTTNASWWASAGLERGQIKNVLKLAFIPNMPQRDLLYKVGINPVTSFPGMGNVMWGQKTLLSKPSSFDRVNVRGLFNTVERALGEMSRYQVFEFNDEYTRNRILQMINPFLESVQAGRGIQEFLVVCDTSNNTPDIISRNQLIVDVYIKPTYTQEFIKLRFHNQGVNDFSTLVN